MPRVRVVVSGRVQGVNYREACRRAAAARGVTGWVRNRPDGTVEAVFDGPAVAVDAMVDWCRRGPRLARVDDLDVVPVADEDRLSRFEVR